MDIVFTGLRPGEKLFEELELSGEQIAKTRHPKIYIGKLNAYPPEEVEGALRFLADLAREADGTAVRKFLNSILPEANLGVRRSTREASPQAAEAPSGARPTPRSPDRGLAVWRLRAQPRYASRTILGRVGSSLPSRRG